MARTKDIHFQNQIDKLQRALSTYVHNTGGLAIHGSSSALAKTVNTVYYWVDGVLYSKAAADMAALAGTVLTTKFGIWVFTVNAAGTLAARAGSLAAATIDALTFPSIPDGEAVIGYLTVNPSGTGSFVGGTSNLDDATIVPGAVYHDTPYPFLPGLQNLV